ncbi:MAG: EscU/YscU/HrcU family type III secretion system export apparatus switch protein [Acidimicrobiales bacterium]|jgi:flagellar biosynthetic protein FlhB
MAAEDKSQKTEKPTPKHKREAKKEGRVARSAEIGSWFSLGVVVLALPSLGEHAVSEVSGFMSLAASAMPANDPAQSVSLLGRGLWTVVAAVGPIVLAAAAAAAVAGYGQVGLHFAPGALGFKWNKISPATGIKRIFSARGAWEISKMALRLGILIGIGYGVDRRLIQSLLGPGTLPIQSTISTAASGLLGLLRDIVGAALVLAIADYAFQRRRFNDSMKMSREQVRREMRETEGNPEVRRALRRRRRRLSRMQILAGVARADVVVVNPTHFSVGLAYDRRKDRAPRVVTKGDDEDALAIRTVALERGVPIVENPPVARALFEACEIGDEVPAQLYQVVARLLAFLYRLTPAQRALVDIHKMAA